MTDQVTLAQATANYLGGLSAEDRQKSQQDLNRFIRWFGGDRPLGRLTPAEVGNYAESVATAGGDFQARLEPVRAFLAFSKKEGLTNTNLSLHLRVKKQPPRSNRAQRPAPKTIHLTEDGHATLQAELERLRAERPKLAEELRRAAADKDFRENAPLDAARERQGHIEARIRELEAILGAASVATMSADHRQADLGATVILYDLALQEEARYTLVHPNEASLSQGKISIASPLGKALLGHQEGDTVEVAAPAGARHYQIRAVNQ